MIVNEEKSTYTAAEAEADEILLAFTEAGDTADVVEWMGLYPTQAREIARFAANRWADRIIGDTPAAAASGAITAERVREIGLETLWHYRHERATSTAARQPAIASLIAAAKARGLDPRALAAALDIPYAFVFKLQRRLIAPDSVPRAFIQALGDALGRTADEAAAYLRMPPTLAAGASYRADDTPAVARPETFADALRSDPESTDAQRARWLSPSG